MVLSSYINNLKFKVMRRLFIVLAIASVVACSEAPLYGPIETNPNNGELRYPEVATSDFEKYFTNGGWELCEVHKVYKDGSIDDNNIIWSIGGDRNEGDYPQRMAANDHIVREYYNKYDKNFSDDASYLFEGSKLYINFHPGAIIGDGEISKNDICMPIYGINADTLEAMVAPTMTPVEEGVIALYLRYENVDAEGVVKWEEKYKAQIGGNIDVPKFADRIANSMIVVEKAYANNNGQFEELYGDMEAIARIVFYTNGECYYHKLENSLPHITESVWVESEAATYTLDEKSGEIAITTDNKTYKAVLTNNLMHNTAIIDGNLALERFDAFANDGNYRYICTLTSAEERANATENIMPYMMYCSFDDTEKLVAQAGDFDDSKLVEALVASNNFNSTIGFARRMNGEWDNTMADPYFEIDFKNDGRGKILYECCESAYEQGHMYADGVIKMNKWQYNPESKEITIQVDVFTDDVYEKQITAKVLMFDGTYIIVEGDFMKIFAKGENISHTETEQVYSDFQRIFCKLLTPDRAK